MKGIERSGGNRGAVAFAVLLPARTWFQDGSATDCFFTLPLTQDRQKPQLDQHEGNFYAEKGRNSSA